MAKIKTTRIFRTDSKTRKTLIDFNIDIKVNSQGKFYATLPDDIRNQLKAINMMPSDFDFSGTCYTDSLASLEVRIQEVIRPLVEFKEIENTIMIKYLIGSACCYVKTYDGQYFPHGVRNDPNLQFIERNGQAVFFGGTEERNGSRFGDYNLSIIVLLRRKITNQYADGTTKTYYTYVDSNDLEENGKWLRELIGMGTGSTNWRVKEDNMPEIAYNEQIALFFRQFVTGLFKINDFVCHMNNADELKEAISKSALNPFNEQ